MVRLIVETTFSTCECTTSNQASPCRSSSLTKGSRYEKKTADSAVGSSCQHLPTRLSHLFTFGAAKAFLATTAVTCTIPGSIGSSLQLHQVQPPKTTGESRAKSIAVRPGPCEEASKSRAVLVHDLTEQWVRIASGAANLSTGVLLEPYKSGQIST